MTTFTQAGFQAEKLAAIQFNGTLVSDKSLQYKDVDLIVKGKTVSVKDQLWSSGKYKAIQVETKLTSSSDNSSIDGCFYKNQSDYYLWRVTTQEHGDTWVVVLSSTLKAFVEAHKASLRKWSTNPTTEAKNRSYGRKYDRAEGYVIPLSEILNIALKVIPVQQGG